MPADKVIAYEIRLTQNAAEAAGAVTSELQKLDASIKKLSSTEQASVATQQAATSAKKAYNQELVAYQKIVDQSNRDWERLKAIQAEEAAAAKQALIDKKAAAEFLQQQIAKIKELAAAKELEIQQAQKAAEAIKKEAAEFLRAQNEKIKSMAAALEMQQRQKRLATISILPETGTTINAGIPTKEIYDTINAYNNLSLAQQKTVGTSNDVLLATKSGGAAFDDLKNKISSAGSVHNEVSTKTKSFTQNIHDLRRVLMDYAIVLYMAKSAVERFYNAIHEGAVLNEQAMSLRLMVNNADEVVSRLQRLSGDILSTGEAIRLANKSILFGYSQDLMDTITKSSRAISRLTGQDFSEIYNLLSRGSIQAKERIVALTGVFIDGEYANQKYAESLGISTTSLTDYQKELAFLKELQEKQVELTNKSSLEFKTQKEELDSLAASIKSFYEGFSKVAGKTFIDFLFPSGWGIDTKELDAQLRAAKVITDKNLKSEIPTDLLRQIKARTAAIKNEYEKSLPVEERKRDIIAEQTTELDRQIAALDKMGIFSGKVVDQIIADYLRLDEIKAILDKKDLDRELKHTKEISDAEAARFKESEAKLQAHIKVVEAAYRQLGLTTKGDLDKQAKDLLSAFQIASKDMINADEVIRAREALFEKLKALSGTAEKEGINILGFTPEDFKTQVEELYNNLLDATTGTESEVIRNASGIIEQINLKGYVEDTKTLIDDTLSSVNTFLLNADTTHKNTFDEIYAQIEKYSIGWVGKEIELTETIEVENERRFSAVQAYVANTNEELAKINYAPLPSYQGTTGETLPSYQPENVVYEKDGGYLGGSFFPITPMANGGVYDKPTFGWIAEAGGKEAVVPLKNEKIPVQLLGGGADNSPRVVLNLTYNDYGNGSKTQADRRQTAKDFALMAAKEIEYRVR